jgi:hypothetical protein
VAIATSIERGIMPKDHNFEVIEGGGELTEEGPINDSGLVPKEEIVRVVTHLINDAAAEFWLRGHHIVNDVIIKEYEQGRVANSELDVIDAINLTEEYINNAFGELGAEIVAVLAGEIEANVDIFPDEMSWKNAEIFVGSWNGVLQQVLELFFPFAESNPEKVEKISDLVGEMKSLNTLLYDEVAIHREDQNGPQ